VSVRDRCLADCERLGRVMTNQSVLIRVPATVGNFAGARNCAALALDASLNVKVTPREDGHVGVRYFGANGERVPRDRTNLIVRSMEAALHLRGLEFTGADLEIYSSVPVGVGLGSSTAAVLAGLLAADRLFRLRLDEKTIFDLASIYEGRPDNLRAAWAGGFVACVEGPSYRRTVVPEDFVLSVVVPETCLSVGGKRERAASERCGLDVHQRAAVLADFFARAGNGPTLDLETPLPPACEKAVPGLEDALQVHLPGLLSVFVCGSGPAIGLLVQGEPGAVVQAVADCFGRRGVATTSTEFRPTNAGARDWNAVHPEVTLPATKGLTPSLASSLEKSTLIPV
jgi:homoserine kinase